MRIISLSHFLVAFFWQSVPLNSNCVRLCNDVVFLLQTTFLFLFQSYCADTLDLSLPDERMFLCHEHSSGAVFVQPFLQTGLYLHHRDQQISLRKFELDLRPPEEYFLHVISVPAHTLAQIETATSLRTETAKDAGNSEQETHTLDQETRKYSSKSFWRRGSKKKDKTKESPITPQPGPLSCFGVSVRKKKKSRKFWR